jgi:hypothetical protein
MSTLGMDVVKAFLCGGTMLMGFSTIASAISGDGEGGLKWSLERQVEKGSTKDGEHECCVRWNYEAEDVGWW